jgi:hypothetical protein
MKMGLKRKPPQGNVRRVVSTGQNIRGVITNKAGRTVQFESWAERSLLLRLDRDPEVTDYGSQPETFKYVDEQGQTRHYTPDFIVWRTDGIEIHEVTCAKRRKQPRMKRREAGGTEICARRGWRYLVHTEQELPQGGELANLLALFRYRPTAYAQPDVAEAIRVRLGSGEVVALSVLIGQVVQELDLPEPRVVAAIGHLLWHGQLKTDLNHLMFGPTYTGLMPGILVWQEVSYDRPTS